MQIRCDSGANQVQISSKSGANQVLKPGANQVKIRRKPGGTARRRYRRAISVQSQVCKSGVNQAFTRRKSGVKDGVGVAALGERRRSESGVNQV